MRNRLSIFIVLIIFVLGFVSCSESVSEKQDSIVLSRDFQDETWGRFDSLTASYSVVKAPMIADLVLEIDVTDVYPNIYPHADDNGLFSITLSIKSPNGSRRSRDFNFHIKDENGKFKSENVNGYYHFELPLINEMSFVENGEYSFKVENKYSKDPLYGIKKLSINSLKVKENKK